MSWSFKLLVRRSLILDNTLRPHLRWHPLTKMSHSKHRIQSKVWSTEWSTILHSRGEQRVTVGRCLKLRKMVVFRSRALSRQCESTNRVEGAHGWAPALPILTKKRRGALVEQLKFHKELHTGCDQRAGGPLAIDGVRTCRYFPRRKQDTISISLDPQHSYQIFIHSFIHRFILTDRVEGFLSSVLPLSRIADLSVAQ